MSRRRSTLENRCSSCLIRKELCFCDHIPSLDLKTKVSIIMHVKEQALTSNTGRIAKLALKNSNIFVRGDIKHTDFSKIYTPSPSYHQLFLYPCNESIPIDSALLEKINKPIELVIPDATWNQAKKFYKREPIFNQMQAVHLKEQHKSIYKLRTQKYEYGVCTLEAIAYALSEIEDLEIKDKLLLALEVMNKRTLSQR